MDSILTTMKKMLGITEEYTHFDTDLIIHINSMISVLTQMGVGDPAGFRIKDVNTMWSDWIDERIDLESIKTYLYLRVKLLFDPPANSTVINAYNEMLKELTYRIYTLLDNAIVDELVSVEEGDVNG